MSGPPFSNQVDFRCKASRVIQDEGFVDRVADDLRRRGWQEPAALALEFGEPASLLLGQFVWLAQPVLRLLMADDTIADAAHLLEQPDAIKALVRRLREPA